MGAASAAYCHCALSAVSIVKAYRRGRKGHPGSMYMSYVRTYIAPVKYLFYVITLLRTVLLIAKLQTKYTMLM